MKVTLSFFAVLFLLLTWSPGAAGAQQATAEKEPIPATDVTAEVIHATLEDEMASGKISDRPIRMVDVGGHNVGIGVIYRPAPASLGGSVYHDKVSEVYYILEGAGTLVTGGKLVNPKQRASGNQIVAQISGPGTTGSGIEGGVSRRIKAGDMVIIPAGTPHWWSEIEGKSMKYIDVRVDPDHVVELK